MFKSIFLTLLIIILKIFKLLNKGNELIQLLKDVLKHEEIDFIATKHTNALKNFATLFNGEKMKKNSNCSVLSKMQTLVDLKLLNLTTKLALKFGGIAQSARQEIMVVDQNFIKVFPAI